MNVTSSYSKIVSHRKVILDDVIEKLLDALESVLKERCEEEDIESDLLDKVMREISQIIASGSNEALSSDLNSIELYSLSFYQFVDEIFDTVKELQISTPLKSEISNYARLFFENPQKTRQINELSASIKKTALSNQIQETVDKNNTYTKNEEINELKKQIANTKNEIKLKESISKWTKEFFKNEDKDLNQRIKDADSRLGSALAKENSQQASLIKKLGETKISANIQQGEIQERLLNAQISKLEREIESLFSQRDKEERIARQIIINCEEKKPALQAEIERLNKEIEAEKKRLESFSHT